VAAGQPDRGHLVYAAGSGAPARHVVRGTGTEITLHALDLAAEPGDLLTQVRDLAACLADQLAARTSQRGVGLANRVYSVPQGPQRAGPRRERHRVGGMAA
jgi:hypothetical protein